MNTRLPLSATIVAAVIVLLARLGAAIEAGPGATPPPTPAAAGVVAAEGEVLGIPDVMTFAIESFANWAEGDYRAYSVGTTSCNVGDAPLEWNIFNHEHPVIGQGLYRLETDEKGHRRFEQIGLSWLKHGFCALDQNECGSCQSTGCLSLGVGCSDPYSAGENGNQSDLGPRFEVNASDGSFPYPPLDPAYQGSTARRLRVRKTDVEGGREGADFFVEAQYVHFQDAPSVDVGRATNNVSYRRIDLDGEGAMTGFIGHTVQNTPALAVWQALDPAVVIREITVPGEGTVRVAYRVYDNGDGTWDYEYAIHNLDFDRAVGGFAVPTVGLVTLTDIGFHDVDYHSGEPIDGTDWETLTTNGFRRWRTTAYADDPHANALRWGTLYNFRFTANAPPVDAPGRLELFRPGSPDAINVVIAAPRGDASCEGDLDGNGWVEFLDLLEVLAAWGDCDGCLADLDGNGIVEFDDILVILVRWGPCS